MERRGTSQARRRGSRAGPARRTGREPAAGGPIRARWPGLRRHGGGRLGQVWARICSSHSRLLGPEDTAAARTGFESVYSQTPSPGTTPASQGRPGTTARVLPRRLRAPSPLVHVSVSVSVCLFVLTVSVSDLSVSVSDSIPVSLCLNTFVALTAGQRHRIS